MLIVGAGPVGLALANELGWRGVDFLLVDEGDGAIPFPSGEGIFSRTMEHLRRWGIASQVRHHPGFPDDYPIHVGFATSLTGKLLAVFEGPSNADMPAASGDISPEGIMICPKQVFDPMLKASAERFGKDKLRYRTRLLSFTQSERGVVARVEDVMTQKQYEIACGYLAGCDGARSVVRKQLGIPYIGSFGEGHNFAVSFKAPALRALMEKNFGRPFFQLHTVNTPRRPYFTTVNGAEEWRMSMYIERGDDPDPLAAITEAIGVAMPIEILRAQPWAGHRVVAEHYGAGRVFLVGDAAHLRWPKGGFGANTGIGDAVDLGWKISAVLEGWGGNALLPSYEAERRPIAIRNVNEASNNRVLDAYILPESLLDDESAAAQARRNAVGNQIHALRLREFRTQGIQLGYRYRGSPICVQDGTLEPPDDHMVYQPSTWPGCRAPHVWISDGKSTLDLFGKGFVLVRTDPGVSTDALLNAAGERGIPMREVTLDTPDIKRLYETPLVLVRPDGHVAWRGAALPKDIAGLLDRITGAA